MILNNAPPIFRWSIQDWSKIIAQPTTLQCGAARGRPIRKICARRLSATAQCSKNSYIPTRPSWRTELYPNWHPADPVSAWDGATFGNAVTDFLVLQYQVGEVASVLGRAPSTHFANFKLMLLRGRLRLASKIPRRARGAGRAQFGSVHALPRASRAPPGGSRNACSGTTLGSPPHPMPHFQYKSCPYASFIVR